MKNKIKRIKESKPFLAIVMLAIGISWTVVSYRVVEIQKDYEEAMQIYESYLSRKVEIKNNLTIKKIKSEPPKETKLGLFYAYNAEVAQTDDTPEIMASGKRVFEGAIANNCLPFGTQIEVVGQVYEVQDRMNSRYGCDVFDIFFWDKDEALNWGKQKLTYKFNN